VKRLAIAAFCAWAALGCREGEPQAQWRVTVATDAPLPALGDRLLVEILPDGATVCGACRRVLSAGEASSWPVSFGIVPAEEPGEPHLRVRLFRASRTGPDGYPEGNALIDALARLPAASGGVVPVAIELRVACFGVPAQPDAGLTCDPSTGTLAPIPVLADAESLPVPGDWLPARTAPCPGEPDADMRCVPGGAFLLGGTPFLQAAADTIPLPERLVRISPFALDRAELTVGRVRELAQGGQIVGRPVTRVDDIGSELAFCTYLGDDDASNDALPVNCVSPSFGAELCAALGKRLPTEAEWEYAAGGRQAETPFAWGTGGDLCELAALGLGPLPHETSAPSMIGDTSCRYAEGGLRPPSPVAGGVPGDVTPDGLSDLTGNLSELCADAFATYDASCWKPEQVLLEDPRCELLPESSHASVRGASFYEQKALARVHHRRRIALGPTVSPAVGLRCAKSF
jgi:formylglycine-generating enzyme required for sulfatase activity